jgi:hypothetical protein
MEDGSYYGYRRDQLEHFTHVAVTNNNERLALFQKTTIPAYITLLCRLEAWDGVLATAKKRALAIRTLGAPLGATDRKAAGISPRVDLGDVFFASLTGKGRTDPKMAAEALCYWPCHLVNNLMRLNLCLSDRSLAYQKVDTRVCCQIAVPHSQTFVSAPSAKMFPLDHCTKWLCTCSFDRGQISDPALDDLPDDANAKIWVDGV